MVDPRYQLTLEERLVISLFRLEFTDEQKTEIRDQMKEVIDWDKFVKSANEHGIIALCWYNISQIGNIDDIPAESLEKLHSGYLKSLTRNTFIYNHLEEVANLAKTQEIKIVLLKGLALEKTLYGNRGLRQMNDLDILVRQEDALKLRKILIENGFETDPVISSIFEKKLFRHGKHLPEMRKNGLSVEIHHKLFDQKGNRISEEFMDKAFYQTGENTILFPDPLLHFLYLIKHLEKHERDETSQLRLYADLVAMAEKYKESIINKRLFELASEASLIKVLAEKLFIMGTFWDLSFPGWTKDPQVLPDHESVLKKFVWFLKHPETEEPETEQQISLKALKEVDGIADKLLFLTGYAFPSPEYLRFRYKLKKGIPVLVFYPVWWIRICWLAVKGLWGKG